LSIVSVDFKPETFSAFILSSISRSVKKMENTDMDIILDPRRNQAADRKKLYEEMLLKEMPGINFMQPSGSG
jgi:hypothetical protein